MQPYIEIILVAILVVILLQPPSILSELVSSILGKALCVGLIIGISHQFGKNAGLLMAMIVILLLNKTREGFAENLPALGMFNLGSEKEPEGSDSGSKCACGQGGKCTCGREGGKCTCGKGGKCSCGKGGKCSCGKGGKCDCGKGGKCSCGKGGKCDCGKGGKCDCGKGGKCDCDKKAGFSNPTLENAAAYPELTSTLVAHTTNDNIMRSMRASEYAKTAPGGTTMVTNHIQTMDMVNNNNPALAGIL
jgi:hypothetical protein